MCYSDWHWILLATLQRKEINEQQSGFFFPVFKGYEKPSSSWNMQTNGFVTQVCASVSFTL